MHNQFFSSYTFNQKTNQSSINQYNLKTKTTKKVLQIGLYQIPPKISFQSYVLPFKYQSIPKLRESIHDRFKNSASCLLSHILARNNFPLLPPGSLWLPLHALTFMLGFLVFGDGLVHDIDRKRMLLFVHSGHLIPAIIFNFLYYSYFQFAKPFSQLLP